MSDCDWKLLAKFSQHGSHTAFATLVKRYRPLVEAACRRILGSGSDSDDVVQATFFQLARCADQLTRDAPARRSLAPWLTRVATNICHDIARSRTARRRHEREYVRRSAASAGSTTTGQLAPLVDELIEELPQQLREPIVLCYLQGIEHMQAAAQLGLSVGTLRRRIQSAKSLLRSRLAARGVPISMFLLHMLMDNRANGGNSSPSPGQAAPIATEPPVPPNCVPPQHPFASPFRRPATSGAASWAVKAGLAAVAIGVIPVLYGVLSGDAPAFATADAANRRVAVEVNAAREAVPPVVDDVASPVMANRMPVPEAAAPLAPEIADSRPSTDAETAPEAEVDTSREAAELLTAAVDPTSAAAVTPVVPSTGSAPVPEELPVVYVTSDTEVPAPQKEVKSATKKTGGQHRDVKELVGIEWHTTLESASAAARGAPVKPIFCFRVLGDLSGFM